MRGDIPKLKLHLGDDGKPIPDEVDRIPKCPDWVSGEVKKQWKKVIALLSERGLAGRATPDVIAAYCKACVDFKDAASTLAKEGNFFKGLHGPRPHPAQRMQEVAMNQMRQLGGVLGLDPVSMQRLGAGKARGKATPTVASRDRKKEPKQGTA